MKYFRIIILVAIALPLIAFAQTPPGFLDSLSCRATGDCQLTDVATGFILLIRLMLGAMGAVALLYFVIGGFQWMTSQGNQEKVRKGQQTMTNTVIALFIAFTSYLLLNFFVNNILGVKSDYQIGAVADQCEGKSNGTVCNTQQQNYECFGGACMTKCASLAADTKQNWACHGVSDAAPLDNISPYWVKQFCPGDNNNICVLLNSSNQPAIFDDPLFEEYYIYFGRTP